MSASDTVTVFTTNGTQYAGTINGQDYVSNALGELQVARTDLSTVLALTGPGGVPLFRNRPAQWVNDPNNQFGSPDPSTNFGRG